MVEHLPLILEPLQGKEPVKWTLLYAGKPQCITYWDNQQETLRLIEGDPQRLYAVRL